MPSGKHNLIQLDSHYFTSTGLVGGTRCRTTISGLKALKRRMVGQTIIALDGTAWTHYQGVKGLPVDMTAFRMASAVYTTVTDAIRAAIQSSSNMTLNITDGAYGDFYLTVHPVLNTDRDGEDEMTSNMVNDIPFTFIVVARNDIFDISAGSLSITGQNLTLTAG